MIQKWFLHQPQNIFSISAEKKSLKEEKAKLAFKSQVHSAFLLKSEDSEKIRNEIGSKDENLKGPGLPNQVEENIPKKKYVKKNIVRLSRK